MNVQEGYNQWAAQYDTNQNKTRDLEAIALRELLEKVHYKTVLEIGAGTGKNTGWFAEKAERVLAVDFSEEMLAKAQLKIKSSKVIFHRADITREWVLPQTGFDLISFSLVLEHVENLDHVFEQVHKHVSSGGIVYIGELHPFKQYAGSKARYQTGEGEQELICFTHHVSDFTNAAGKYGLKVEKIEEYFDEGDRSGMPRLLTLLLSKK